MSNKKEVKFERRAFIEKSRKQAVNRLIWLEDRGKSLSVAAYQVQKETLDNVLELCRIAEEKDKYGRAEMHLIILHFFAALQTMGKVGNVKVDLDSLEYDVIKGEKILNRKIYLPGDFEGHCQMVAFVAKDLIKESAP